MQKFTFFIVLKCVGFSMKHLRKHIFILDSKPEHGMTLHLSPLCFRLALAYANSFDQIPQDQLK